MRIPRSAALWLLAAGLALAAPPTRAAVMTTNVQVLGNGPFDVKYVLAQDVSSLKLEIVNASNTAVRTWDSSVAGTFQAADLLKGSHTLTGFWNGRNDSNVSVPSGDYYARVTTTGGALAAMTLLSGPKDLAPQPTKTQARNIYGGGVNQDPTSPFFNVGYFGVCTSGNAAGSAGVDQVYADASSAFFAPGTGSYEFVTAAVFTDGVVVAGGQTNNTLRLINPVDGSTIGTDISLGVSPRSIAAVGSSTAGQVFFLDGTAGGIKAWDMAGGYPIDVLADSNFIINGAAGSTPQAGLAVNKAGTSLWVDGRAIPVGSLVYPGFIYKFDKQGDGTWLKDNNFNAALPNYDNTVTSTYLRGLALSADETTLWVTSNNVNASRAANNQVAGLVASTGASKGAAFTYNFVNGTTITGMPQGIAAAKGGNLYVSLWPGPVTGTTALDVAVLSPPSESSTDVTVGRTFTLGPPLTATNPPTVDAITYHSGTVLWSTDGDADSTVKYGKTAGNLDKTASNPAAVTDHSILLEGLDSNTTYYYQVISSATGRANYSSPVQSFITNALNVTDAAVADVTENWATFTWTTDDGSNSWVDLGFDGVTYPIRIGNDTVTTAGGGPHTVMVRGLKFGTTYHWRVETGWPGATPVYSPDATLKTLDYVQITNETIQADSTTATLNYTTNIASAATVHYGTDPASLTSTLSAASGTQHAVVFPSLSAGTTYFYSLDLSGGTSAARTTRVSAFTTLVASTPAATITDNSADKFGGALLTQVTVGASGGLLSLDKQMLTGTPVASPNKIPLPTRYQGWATWNGYLYNIGGYTAGGGLTDKVFVAKVNSDGTVGTWAETSPLPAPRRVVTGQCIAYNGTVYLVGGDDASGNVVGDVYYAKQNADGTLQAWQTGPTIPDADGNPDERDIAAMAVVNGNLVITGGEPNDAGVYSVRTNFLAVLKADGSIREWYQITPPTEAIYLERIVANAGVFYNAGGLNDTDPANGVRFTDTVDTSWTQPNSDLTPGYRNPFDPAHTDAWMDAEHYGFACVLAGGKLWALGGRITVTGAHGEIAHSKIAADGLTTKWVVDAADGSANALPIPIYDNEGVVVNGNVYVSPGRLAGNVENDTVQIVPLVPEATGYAYSGTVEGRVIDLGAVSNLSHIRVSGTNVNAGTVEVRYRFAGASGEFSDWFTAGVDADINGGARYVQYQLVLKGDGTTTPVVNSVAVSVGPFTNVLPGDVDKSGVVDANDVKAALRIAAGLVNANDSAVSFTNADVTGNHAIGIPDAVKILRIVDGK